MRRLKCRQVENASNQAAKQNKMEVTFNESENQRKKIEKGLAIQARERRRSQIAGQLTLEMERNGFTTNAQELLERFKATLNNH